jgi:hypothetical protein
MIGSGTRSKFLYNLSILLQTLPLSSEKWIFESYSLTSPPNTYTDINPLISIEDFIRDHFGNYNSFGKDSLAIVIGILIFDFFVDDNVLTAQNKKSTIIAIQTFILMCNR